MRKLVLRWSRPNIDLASIAATDVFGGDHGRICETSLALAI